MNQSTSVWNPKTLAGLVLLASLSGCAAPRDWVDSMPWGNGDQVGADSAADGGTSSAGNVSMARLIERRGQADQAEKMYQAALAKDPNNPVPYHRLGIVNAKEGHFEAAEFHFQRAMELDPENAELLVDAGYFFYLSERMDISEPLLRRALELDPNSSRAANTLAVVLGVQGRDDECLAMFRRCGTEAEACANVAFVFAQRGDFENASRSYSRALSLDEQLRPAAEGLIQVAKYVPPERRAAPPQLFERSFHAPVDESPRRERSTVIHENPLLEQANANPPEVGTQLWPGFQSTPLPTSKTESVDARRLQSQPSSWQPPTMIPNAAAANIPGLSTGGSTSFGVGSQTGWGYTSTAAPTPMLR